MGLNQHQYWVYIMMSLNGNTTYIGVTNDLERRVKEHKDKLSPSSFTSKYNCTKLVYYEDHHMIEQAIAREKQLKNWHRDWKLDLIKEDNPELKDLAHDWYDSE
jgi:putative endonuclease